VTTTADTGLGTGPGTGRTTLAQELRAFTGRASARLIAAVLVVVVAARLLVGDWTLGDAAAAGIILALHPFSEWVIHVGILHLRPRRVGRWTIDPLLARRHRLHHADPTDQRYVYIPIPSLLVAMPVTAAAMLLLLPTVALALTTMAVTTAILLVYEWTHTLIHSTTYRPRTRLYRAIWRAHRLHHYKNEQYWFGVTVHGADRLLGTYPDPSEVPTSETARTLAG
jgi:sterol desaturase/sphingolipid hydroxylase (fatty acid hydroxylase superfamily)